MSKLRENIFKLRRKQTDEIDDILVQIPIFQDLNSRELNIIKRILHKRGYKTKIFSFAESSLLR